MIVNFGFMGCSASEDAAREPAVSPAKMQKKKISREFLVQKNLVDQTIIRKEGDIDGNPFQLENLKNCKVYVADIVDSMTIDCCENCDMALSAIKGSIFIRDCRNCSFTMNCGQFRCRSCKDCHFFMHSRTGPVIESTTNCTIGCGTFSYENVLRHFRLVNIDPFMNTFDDVHDFTPGPSNYTLEVGKQLELDIAPNTVTDIPFFYPYKPGKYTSVTFPDSNWSQFVKLTLDGIIKIVAMRKQGVKLVAQLLDETPDSVSPKIQCLDPISIECV